MKLKTPIKNKNLISIAILSLTLSANSCLAGETLNIRLGSDYILTAKNQIKSNYVEDPKMLSIKSFFTIFNEKNILLIHPEKVGKTKLTIFYENCSSTLNITVKEKNADSEFIPYQKNGEEMQLLDTPPSPQTFEIDTPPAVLKEGK